MKKGSILLTLMFMLMTSCRCQTINTVVKDSVSNINLEDEYSTVQVEIFLGEQRFTLLDSVHLVSRFAIEKKIIEGTEDEYYNHLNSLGDLTKQKTDSLIQFVKNDNAYLWAESIVTNKKFNPSRQFILKASEEQLTLLVDEDLKQIGFIDLSGLKIITMTNEFTHFIMELK